MVRAVSTALGVVLLIALGLSSMFLYLKLMGHEKELSEFVMAQGSQHTVLAKQLRDETATQDTAIGGKVSALAQQLADLKAKAENFLKTVEILSQLTDSQRASLASVMEELTFSDGE